MKTEKEEIKKMSYQEFLDNFAGKNSDECFKDMNTYNSLLLLNVDDIMMYLIKAKIEGININGIEFGLNTDLELEVKIRSNI